MNIIKSSNLPDPENVFALDKTLTSTIVISATVEHNILMNLLEILASTYWFSLQ